MSLQAHFFACRCILLHAFFACRNCTLISVYDIRQAYYGFCFRTGFMFLLGFFLRHSHNNKGLKWPLLAFLAVKLNLHKHLSHSLPTPPSVHLPSPYPVKLLKM